VSGLHFSKHGRAAFQAGVRHIERSLDMADAPPAALAAEVIIMPMAIPVTVAAAIAASALFF